MVQETKPATKKEKITKPESNQAIIPLAADSSAQLSKEPLPASVIPDLPQVEINTEIKDDEIIMALGDRRYRIRGLHKNLSLEQL